MKNYFMNPADINLLTLPSVPLDQRSLLPSTSGIYFVLSISNEVLYIGRAINIRQRWLKHHRQEQLEEIYGVSLAWLEINNISNLVNIELALIKFFNPKFNRKIQFNKYKKSEVVVLKTGSVISTLKDDSMKFWSNVNESDECLVWQGHVDENGYGVFSVANNRKRTFYKAHRVAWELVFGNRPQGKIGNKCGNKLCVNPNHWYAISSKEAAIERYWKFVEITEECWHWKGPVSSSGYGVLYLNRGSDRQFLFAHRITWEQKNGQTTKQLRNVCSNILCVNPNHWKELNLEETVFQRFENKILKVGDCWEWQAGIDKDGYGKFNVKGKTVRAHRAIWELLYGEISEGIVLSILRTVFGSWQ